MIDDHVKLQLVQEVKLHLGQLRIIRRQGSRGMFPQTRSGFGQDGFDMDGRLFDLGRHVDAGGEDKERVGLGERVFGVEPFEIDAGGGYGRLAERNLAGEFVDEGGEVDMQGEDVLDGEVVKGVIGEGFEEVVQRGQGNQPCVTAVTRMRTRRDVSLAY